MAVCLCSEVQAASACSSSWPPGLFPAALSELQTDSHAPQQHGQTKPLLIYNHLKGRDREMEREEIRFGKGRGNFATTVLKLNKLNLLNSREETDKTGCRAPHKTTSATETAS